MKVRDNLRRDVSALLDYFDAHDHIAIYGAGEIACGVAEVLMHHGRTPHAFIVSDSQSVCNRADRIPVRRLSEFDPDSQAWGIVLGLAWENHAQVCADMEPYGFSAPFPAEWMRTTHDDYADAMAVMYILHTLDNLEGFRFDDEVWNFNGCRLPNVYLLTQCRTWEPAAELHGFVLPALGYGGLLPGPERPYEYGAVSLAEGDIVLDCGANYGFFSAVAAFRGCVVHAFEPSPKNLPILEKTRRMYLDAITVAPYALSDKCGTAILDESENGIMAHLIPEGSSKEKCVKVATTTIDQYVEKNRLPRVDFIKVDIEGSEGVMLRGARETLKRFAPKLAICTYHKPKDREVLSDLIRDANPEYRIEYGPYKLYATVPKA